MGSTPPAAFTNDGFNPKGYFKSFTKGYLVGKVNRDCCLTAPVIFPKDAKLILGVLVYVEDVNESKFEWFDFYRLDLQTGIPEFLGRVSTEGLEGFQALEFTLSDNGLSDGYAYYIGTCVRKKIYVYGVEIFYE
jgi:hypothetical protein